MIKRIFVMLLISILILSLAIVGYAVSLKSSAGSVGGVWYTVSAGLGEIVKEVIPDIDIKTVPGGGLANLARVSEGESEIGVVYSTFVPIAMKGIKPFEKEYPNIRVLATGFGKCYLQFVMEKKHGITSVDQLIDQKFPLKIAVDRVGTTDEWALTKVLEYYNLTYKDLEEWGGKVFHTGYSDQATLMKDRHANAMFQNIAVPSAAVMEVKIGQDLVLLTFPEDLRKFLNEKYGFALGDIQAGSYEGTVEKDTPSLLCITTFIVNKDVPDEIVYKITKAICENTDRVRAIHDSCKIFDPKIAWKDGGGPVHPGAEKYYREMGFMK